VVRVSVSKTPTGEETLTTETAVYLRKNQYGYFFLSHYNGDSEMALEATEQETNVDTLISAMEKDGVKKIQKLSETEFLVSTEYQDQSFATSCQTKMDVSKSLSLTTTDCKDGDGNTYTSSLKSVKKVELSKYEGELKATKLRVQPNILNEFDEEVIDETEKDWSHLIK
jgi:hypothetical protein